MKKKRNLFKNKKEENDYKKVVELFNRGEKENSKRLLSKLR